MPDPTTLLVGLAVIVLVFVLVKRAGQISPDEAHKLIEEDALILDVRTPGEFESDHLDGAVNTPLTSLSADISDLQVPASRPILAYCLSGTRSSMAVRTLKSNGFTNVHNLGSLHRAKKITARH
jgi:phage shock protein E